VDCRSEFVTRGVGTGCSPSQNLENQIQGFFAPKCEALRMTLQESKHAE
jgi:hypothetical protein